MNKMVNNDVCDEFREVLETTITAVVCQIPTIDNEILPLPLTSRMNINRKPPQSCEFQKDRHAHKSLFTTTDPLIASNNIIRARKATIETYQIDDTPTDNSPIDNLPLSESLAEKNFFPRL